MSSSISNRNTNASAAANKSPLMKEEMPAAKESRFSKLRSSFSRKDEAADKEPKGYVAEIIPGRKISDRRVLEHRFPNAAERMNQYRYTPKPTAQKGVLSRIKDSVVGAKESKLIKNDDGTQGRIDNDDQLLWRRMHLQAIEAERREKAEARNAKLITKRVDKLHKDNEEWKVRVKSHKEQAATDFEDTKKHLQSRRETASARHQMMMKERVSKLAYKDKVRAAKAKKAPRPDKNKK